MRRIVYEYVAKGLKASRRGLDPRTARFAVQVLAKVVIGQALIESII